MVEPVQIEIMGVCVTPQSDLVRNVKKSAKYQRIRFKFNRPPCAVVGGGWGLLKNLNELKDFKGDIYAINNTAEFLSTQGIPSYIYAVDGMRRPFKLGPLVKGALFYCMVNRTQFNQFKFEDIQVFDPVEDDLEIMRGPSAASHAASPLLRMGYEKVYYYGCESSFNGGTTHVYGNDDYGNTRCIVRAGEEEFDTVPNLILQAQYLSLQMKKFPSNLINKSEGLLKGMLENINKWGIVAGQKEFMMGLGQECQQVYNPPNINA